MNLFKRNLDILIYLALLTFFFIMLEISFFIQCNSAYLSDYTFMAHHLDFPWGMLPAIFYFLFAQLCVHAAFTLIVWLNVIAFVTTVELPNAKRMTYSIAFWVLAMLIVLAANQAYLPNSKFAELSAIFLPDKILTFIVYIGSMVLLLNVLTFLALNLQRMTMITTFAFIGFGFIAYDQYQNPSIHSTADIKKPNIIIIGVDSLRPDHLGFFGSSNNTPFIDNFLEHATVFSQSVTPLARTFPSWTGILTGNYPKQTGMRSNLTTQSRLDTSGTLATILKQEGYETVFATDETRFSNIDAHFGFDRVVTPPMGLNDFLLGNFNDFPLSNLLINTVIGEILFPHSFANRPVYFAYNPNSFLHLVKPYVLKDRAKPLFLAIHFCLPHHPYLWGNLSGVNNHAVERYELSIERVDQQLRDFYAMLQEAHLLDHAIVVFLSDHGEALALNGDRITEDDLFLRNKKQQTPPVFFTPMEKDAAINKSVGHGTDVLGLTQYHTVLAFQLHGFGNERIGIIPGTVSLLDIKPTLLDFIQKSHSPYSLVKVIRDQVKKVDTKRHIFTESDFTPKAILTMYPDTRNVILDGIELFKIDPLTIRLTVRDDMLQKIIKSKQYADIYDHWMLAIYPESFNKRVPILVDLDTGVWTNDMQSSFAKRSPAKLMLDEMKKFYGNEITGV